MQNLLYCLSPEWARIRANLRQRILTVDAESFESLALDVFRYQAALNPTYRAFLNALRVEVDEVQQLAQVPFMPIGFFKHHAIVSAEWLSPAVLESAVCFASSGTTGATTSHHYLFDEPLYDQVSRQIFEATYGPLTNVHILALLPSYLERNNSSLVYMVRQFIEQTGSAESGFYLHDTDGLTRRIRHLLDTSSRTILLMGVTFALLDWVESATNLAFIGESKRVLIMETGGMKGRRREMLREEVHEILTDRLQTPRIHSEYGMTELLSQGYSTGEGVFRPGATMQIRLRDINDPFTIFPADYTRTGGINVIDLANLDSCSFIETQDLGQNGPEPGTFRVMGRFDNSDVRGCNLMV
ncbi:hypothetical protein [Rudanella lutea]|uniref:hypothetical protein n=1 Tax=Rudanella lutea TaxID=451374 RepID=UPI00035DF76B|nr:hypothetical protein [Rudanella lutea]